MIPALRWISAVIAVATSVALFGLLVFSAPTANAYGGNTLDYTTATDEEIADFIESVVDPTYPDIYERIRQGYPALATNSSPSGTGQHCLEIYVSKTKTLSANPEIEEVQPSPKVLRFVWRGGMVDRIRASSESNCRNYPTPPAALNLTSYNTTADVPEYFNTIASGSKNKWFFFSNTPVTLHSTATSLYTTTGGEYVRPFFHLYPPPPDPEPAPPNTNEELAYELFVKAFAVAITFTLAGVLIYQFRWRSVR